MDKPGRYYYGGRRETYTGGKKKKKNTRAIARAVNSSANSNLTRVRRCYNVVLCCSADPTIAPLDSSCFVAVCAVIGALGVHCPCVSCFSMLLDAASSTEAATVSIRGSSLSSSSCCVNVIHGSGNSSNNTTTIDASSVIKPNKMDTEITIERTFVW